MSDRTNTWTFLIYPDSYPTNYLEIIQSWHVPTLLSPNHLNKDKLKSKYNKYLNYEKDLEKKEHIHVMLYFGKGANKSFDQVEKFSNQLNGTRPEMVNTTDALIRYFVHKDNPEKEPFEINELIPFSGFEYLQAFETYTNENQLYNFIEDFIDELHIEDIYDVIKKLKELGKDYETMFVRKHIYFFEKYCNSKYFKRKKEIDKLLNKKNKD